MRDLLKSPVLLPELRGFEDDLGDEARCAGEGVTDMTPERAASSSSARAPYLRTWCCGPSST